MTSASLTFADAAGPVDLRTYLQRARSVRDEGARLQVVGTVLATWVPILNSAVIGERTPTILGLRTSALAVPAEYDAVVSIGALLDRLARRDLAPREADDVVLPLPPVTLQPAWAGVSAPQTDWRDAGALDSGSLVEQARQGIKDVAQALPAQAGAAMVSNARAFVWAHEVSGCPGLPLGAAFAGYSLGFWRNADPVQVFRSGAWWRLSSPAGHVLAKPSAIL